MYTLQLPNKIENIRQPCNVLNKIPFRKYIDIYIGTITKQLHTRFKEHLCSNASSTKKDKRCSGFIGYTERIIGNLRRKKLIYLRNTHHVLMID